MNTFCYTCLRWILLDCARVGLLPQSVTKGSAPSLEEILTQYFLDSTRQWISSTNSQWSEVDSWMERLRENVS